MLSCDLKIKAVKYDIIKDIYSLSARDKINSVCVYENDFVMDRILNDMNLWEIGRFLLNMFNLYSNMFSIVRSSEYYNWNIINSFYFDSKPITVSEHNIAISLPRRLREKYFINLDWKWKIDPDLYLNWESNELE